VGQVLYQRPRGINGDGVILVAGSFAPNGATSPVATTIKGKYISSITYAAGSLWQVQFIDSYAAILGAGFMLQGAAGWSGQGFTVEIDYTTTVITTGLLVLRSLNTSGTAADIAAATGGRVNFWLALATDASNT
jgi:hypothetical protein